MIIINKIYEREDGNGQGIISRDFSLLIRGICCLIIVIHHYAILFHNLYGTENLILKIFAYYGGCLGVGVFFFLSGYGITISSKNKALSFAQILRQRYWKLIWPILIVNSIYLIIRYFIGMNNFHSASDFVLSFINIKEIDRALWFVEVLFYCYALFYLYAYLARKVSQKFKVQLNASIINLVILTSLFGLLTFAIKYIYVERFWYHVNIPMFLLGVIYSEYYKQILRWMTPIVTLLLFIIVSGLTFYFTIYSYRAFAFVGYGLDAVIFIIGISRRFYIVTAYNSLIGIISLEIYLTHYKLLNFVSKDRTELGMSFWVYFVLSILIGLITYILLHRKLPIIKKQSLKNRTVR